jgi:eukaryotic-like serine/threonine-protein kinase
MKGITPEQWQSISAYLDQALELEEAERAQWLAALAQSDPATAELLSRVLAGREHEGFSQFLAGPTPIPLDYIRQATLIGRQVGPYVIEAEVGRGGMGSVWRARRADGRFEGEVAIKFVHAAWIGRIGEQRFLTEGNLLGHLNHPNIARLIDAGVLDTSQPYLVIEYVEGQPIDAYCDQHRLGVEDRIRLFLNVLAAVAHAHSHLIVHRDIKPANIYVSSNGAVKLLDFGIAKLLEDEAGSAALTKSGAIALTPLYAAPEQLLGGLITTATDVYALGVVLYVMLVGLHPLARDGRTGADLVRAATIEDRPRASALAAPRGSDGAHARDAALRAQKRGTTARQLSRSLAGDLDNILTRALAVSPAERYAAASDLAADLRRFLSHEPVQAHAPGWRYRLTKLLRRRPLESVLVAGVLLAIGMGLAATFWQWRIAEAQRRAAIEQRVRAERMLARTVAANDFTTNLLTEMAQVTHPVRFSDIIERGEKLALGNGGDAAQRAHALLALANFYLAVNDNAKGEELTRRAGTFALEADDRPLAAIADCMQGIALAGQGKREAGEALAVQGLTLAGDDSEASYRCYEAHAQIAQMVGNAPQTLEFGRKALEIANRARWISPAARAGLLDLIGAGESSTGNLEEANTYFQQALDLLSRAGLSESLEASVVLSNMAFLLERQGQVRAAMDIKEHVLKIQISIAGEDGVAVALWNNSARTLLRLNRLDEAAELAGHARVKGAQVHDEVAQFVANIMIANVRKEQRRFQEAQQMIDEARHYVGESPGTMVASMVTYTQARLFLAEGNAAMAIAALDALQADMDAYARRTGSRSVIGSFSEAMSMTRAQALADIGHLREGIAFAEEAVALSRKTQGKASVSADTGEALLLLAELSAKLNGPKAVTDIAREADRNLTEALGPNHPKSVRARALLAAAGG